MKRIGLITALLYVMILTCYSQKQEETKTSFKDIQHLNIELHPAFDKNCCLTIDTSKKSAFFIVFSEENKEIFKEEISYTDLINKCNVQSLFTESVLKNYQYNPEKGQNEDGMGVEFKYQTKTKNGIVDAGNDYKQQLSDIITCSLTRIKINSKDSEIISYIDQLIKYL